MFKFEELKRGLFFDIESVAQYKSFDEAPKRVQAAWVKRCDTKYRRFLDEGMTPAELYFDKAPINPEFTKIVCISFGVWAGFGAPVHLKSFYGRNEFEIMQSVSEFLSNPKVAKRPLIGANIQSYDIPLMFQRFYANAVTPPMHIQTIYEAKPWESNRSIDICLRFAAGTNNNKFVYFDMICHNLGIPTPKDEMDGSMVGQFFYDEENDLMHEIKTYCEKDVAASVKVVEKAVLINNPGIYEYK